MKNYMMFEDEQAPKGSQIWKQPPHLAGEKEEIRRREKRTLGWLRSSEALGLCWSDLTLILPQEGPSVDLPLGIGAILMRLAPETKSSRAIDGDVVVAYTTASRLSLGTWVRKACEFFGLDRHSLPKHRIFTHPNGQPWTSVYFRETHLYPHLRRLQAQGDAYLSTLVSIPAAFWSMHCYRRGSRSAVSGAASSGRLATAVQIYEHARWRLQQKQSEAIDKIYQEWTLFNRIQLSSRGGNWYRDPYP